MAAARISLCMIVRDEEELLPRFFAAARGLWDELVVVDTGSVDRTSMIAEDAGARVLHHAWGRDFAAARNVGVEAATGDFVLFLDADELADPGLAAELRALVADERVGGATVRLRNLLPHGHVRESHLLRLFRRAPGVRFAHAIHEDVGGSLFPYLARTGKRLGRLVSPIEHLGYVRARAAARDKKTRDRAILMETLDRDPTDLYCWFKLLELARFWSDRPLGAAAAARCLDHLRRVGFAALAGRYYGGELLALLADFGFPEDPAGRLALFERGGRAVEPSAAFFFHRGMLHEGRGALDAAEHDFARCLTFAGDVGDLQLATVRPSMGLARVALARGEVARAADRVSEALAHAPADPEVLLFAVFLARATGGPGAVDRLVADHGARHGLGPELDEAQGEALLLVGDAPGAVRHLERAAAARPGGRVGLRLAEALLTAGRIDACAARCAALRVEIPEAGLGALLCALIDGGEARPDADLDLETAEAALRRFVAALRQSGRADLLRAARDRAASVRDAFPWLERALSG